MSRIIVFLFLFLVSFSFACQSSKHTSSAADVSNQNEVSPVENASAGRDGSSFEKAIIVKSVSEEYDWLRKNCSGCKFERQSLRQDKGKYYDVLTVKLQNGSKKEFFFDINSFFGKF